METLTLQKHIEDKAREEVTKHVRGKLLEDLRKFIQTYGLGDSRIELQSDSGAQYHPRILKVVNKLEDALVNAVLPRVINKRTFEFYNKVMDPENKPSPVPIL